MEEPINFMRISKYLKLEDCVKIQLIRNLNGYSNLRIHWLEFGLDSVQELILFATTCILYAFLDKQSSSGLVVIAY